MNHGFVRTPGGVFTSFDAPGAGNGEDQGTFAPRINQAGAVAGDHADAKSAYHGFVRAPDGTITTFDAPGALVYTFVTGINAAGGDLGVYMDENSVAHGYVRAPDAVVTTFEAPGAGSGSFQGTEAYGISLNGAIVG